MTFEKEKLKKQIIQTLQDEFSVEPHNASDIMFYKSAAIVVRDILQEKRRRFITRSNSKGQKMVNYMCIEFLLGRTLKSSIYNLEMVTPLTQALADMGVKIDNLFECEPDAGLGNGGLGRLAACFMDALATLEVPSMGYSLIYEFGIFKQKIVDGWQTEQPDNWLPGGDVWLVPHPEQEVQVRFGGQIEEFWDNNYHHITHKNFTVVRAIPYDMYLSGYDSDGVSVLRLWKAQSPSINMDLFNSGDYSGAMGEDTMAELINKVLYPNDNHAQGKMLRLRQQYFLVAASIADIVSRHFDLYGTLENMPEKEAIHINDTHPSLAIPELMRVLLDDFGYSWDKAWDITTRTFAYTNHTVMSEALEKWNEEQVRELLPRIYQLIVTINEKFCKELFEKYHRDFNQISQMSVIAFHQIRMANLSVVGSHSVNGVSKLHSQILKDDLFKPFYDIDPNKFTNVTNGIASRRWLYQSNPELTAYIGSLIGKDFLKDFDNLHSLNKFGGDPAVQTKLAAIKRKNKERFALHIKDTMGISLNLDSIFDVQVKRLHEYKRQHLNALHILSLYNELKENPNADIKPRTFIFGAKAAPGYFMAKQIIRLICTLAKELEKDPQIRDILRIVFLEDYKVTMSELLMPAAEVSEQISLAGKEASGTGNMKLMLNGAVTLGTLDGANVEILDAVGPENIVIFGMTAGEVVRRQSEGYHPYAYYQSNPVIRKAIDRLSNIGGENFSEIAESLKRSDPFMVLADFDSYCEAQRNIQRLYADQAKWQEMSLKNIAGSGTFCADRSIRDYANQIWGIPATR